MPKTVTITWKAFEKPGSPAASVTFNFPSYLDKDLSDIELCELAFRATNIGHTPLWSWTLKDILPDGRSHTALSIGDEIAIDNVVYRCASHSWEVRRDESDWEQI